MSTNIFTDTFTTGGLESWLAHYPDTTLVAGTWADPQTGGVYGAVNGGILTCMGGVNASNYAQGSHGLSTTESFTTGFSAVVSFTCPAVSAPSAAGIFAAGITVFGTASGYTVNVVAAPSAGYFIVVNNGAASAAVTLVANGTYSITVSAADGLQTATVNGVTVTTNDSYSVWGQADNPKTIYARVGYGSSISSITLNTNPYVYASASLTLPKPTVVLSAGGVNAASLVMPMPTLLTLLGGGAAMQMAAPTLSATGHDSTGERAAYLAMPSPSLSSATGGYAALVMPPTLLLTSGIVTGSGSAELSMPLPTFLAAGTISGTSNAALRLPKPNLVGYSGAVCSVTLTGSPTLSATGTTGAIGGAALTCPLFELSSAATDQNHGGANLLMPMPQMGQTAQAWLTAPGMTLTAIGQAVVAATYEAYATNLKHNPKPGVEPHDEVTHYTNFPFTHVVRYQNSYYGANSTGLYLLEGTTDDTAPITWDVKTATTDFKSPQNKTVASAYFGGRLGPADTITLHAGEGAKVQAYSYTTPRGALAQNYRQAFGKGIKSHRYYALEASGTGELALDDISLDVHNLSRRI